jgi:hypothetical protein
MLHGLVEGVVHSILDMTSQESGEPLGDAAQQMQLLRKNLFGEADLLERINNAFATTKKAEVLPKGGRLGYMGHVLRICDALVESFPAASLSEFGVSEEKLSMWQGLVNGQISEELQTQQVLLGGHRPGAFRQEEEYPSDKMLASHQFNMLEQGSFLDHTSYDTSNHDDNDDDDDDDDDDDEDDAFFNWEHTGQIEVNSSDSDEYENDIILQEVAPAGAPAEEDFDVYFEANFDDEVKLEIDGGEGEVEGGEASTIETVTALAEVVEETLVESLVDMVDEEDGIVEVVEVELKMEEEEVVATATTETKEEEGTQMPGMPDSTDTSSEEEAKVVVEGEAGDGEEVVGDAAAVAVSEEQPKTSSKKKKKKKGKKRK